VVRGVDVPLMPEWLFLSFFPGRLESIDLLLTTRRGVGAFAGCTGTDLVTFTLFTFTLLKASFGFVTLTVVLGLIRIGSIRVALGNVSISTSTHGIQTYLITVHLIADILLIVAFFTLTQSLENVFTLSPFGGVG